ncbi:DEAD/DEAH box helicase [Candidatus Saccharibacteria bacterium]|nr:DEAD/DEAH box helicase [Candidatus Saccharibacteria bacterium]
MPQTYHSSRPRRAASFQNGRSSAFGGRRAGSGFGGGRKKNLAKQQLDPARFVKAAQHVEVAAYEPTHTFNDFVINDLLKRNIAAKGFTAPSPIQDQAIPHALEGKDVLGIANTGTGKTAAFAIPLLNAIMADKSRRALIMAPTRELAAQIEEELRAFARGSGLFGALVIGGTAMGKQIRELRGNPNVIIGTPGRLKDHVQQGTIDLSIYNIVVLDEVDRMVDMGFINDIRFLLGETAEEKQSLFFSATMDPKVESLISTFMPGHVTVSVKTGHTSDNVDQDVIHYGADDEKLDKLHDVLIDENVVKTLIFHETKYGAERLSKALNQRGFKTEAIHGGKSQGQRQRALDAFKDNKVDTLVATDVAARGIDVSDITHVINYSIPNNYDDYTHRVGRAGRAGRKGYALTFVKKHGA